MQYINDDRAAASAFLSDINRKVVRSRFSEVSAWQPDHITLAVVGGESVAMADLVVLGSGEAVNAGLLAKPGFGAYAVKALLQLKGRVAISHWQSTLTRPTAATVAISRRYFTQTFDQPAFELAGAMVEKYGHQNYLNPVPLLASDEFLKMSGLPRLKSWSDATRLQLLKAASRAGSISLTTPSGITLSLQDVTAIAFDLLSTPYDARQQFSRVVLSAMVAKHGHDPSALMGKMLKPDGSTPFLSALRDYVEADIPTGGVFEMEYDGAAHPFGA